MPKLNWDSDDFRTPQDSSGTTTEQISGGGLEQGYIHGSLTQGLVAYYPMDSGSGSTLTDKALADDGVINGASWTTDSRIGNSCLSFDGDQDYVDIGNVNLADSFTVSQWVNLSEDKDWNNTFGSESILSIISYNDGKIKSFIGDGNNWLGGPTTDTGKTNPGTWQLWTVTYDGSVLRFFLNQQLEDSVSISTDVPIAKHYIGDRYNQANSYNTNGKIDDVRIYDRPLSTPEIKALYNLNRPSKVSPGDTIT